MKITAIETHIISTKDKNLFVILDKYLPGKIEEGSIFTITSKIVSLSEGRVIPIDKADKGDLVKREADLYLPPESNKYNVYVTIKNNLFLATAGIDESNAQGNFVLLPTNPQKTANDIREYLVKKYNLKKIGVIITDSKTTPLRWGVTGAAIAHSGFQAINNLGEDLFGRKLVMTVAVMDALAVAAVVVMGESNEQTPIAIVSDVPFVRFQHRNPTEKELKDLSINMEDDLYAPLLKGVNWRRGKS